MTKTSKSVTYTVDCPVDSAFPFAVMMLEGSFDVPDGFSSAQMSSFSLITWTYEPLSTMTSFFLWWHSHRDATTSCWMCLFGGQKKYSHTWKKPQLCIMSVQTPNILANKFQTSARLSNRSYDTTLGCLPSQLYAEKSSLDYLTQICAWVTSNVLATTTEPSGIFLSHPARSECLNTHLVPILQPSFFLIRRILWWMPIFTNSTPCWQSHSLIANHVGVCSMSKVSFLSKVLFPRLDLGFCSARNSLFKLSFTRREMLLTNICSRYKTSISFNLM